MNTETFYPSNYWWALVFNFQPSWIKLLVSGEHMSTCVDANLSTKLLGESLLDQEGVCPDQQTSAQPSGAVNDVRTCLAPSSFYTGPPWRTATFSTPWGKGWTPQVLLTSYPGQEPVDSAALSTSVRCFNETFPYFFTNTILLARQRTKQVTPRSIAPAAPPGGQKRAKALEQQSCAPPRARWGDSPLRSREPTFLLSQFATNQ